LIGKHGILIGKHGILIENMEFMVKNDFLVGKKRDFSREK
jgi:hypothetical protein